VRGNGATEKLMAGELDQLRKTIPDLMHQDPLSAEVREWLDRAYNAVRQINHVEGIVLRVHERHLLDPARKRVASAEIAETVERAARTSSVIHRLGIPELLAEH
jgi:hypothetical protein